MEATIRYGIDIILNRPPAWKRKQIGMVTNNAAVTNRFLPSRKALLQEQFNLVKLFSPEHGLDTTGADGRAMHNSRDMLTGLPVISLYGDKLAPGEDDLGDIDLLLIDLPDIGSRFYTYLWTMTHILEAAARFNKPLIVLDRPNPLSGRLSLAEGPLLDEAHASSFIGRWQMPVRHSCTLGELALYFNATKKINASLEVIGCKGWNRNMMYHDYSPSFVPPSPAINCFESALLYPGGCLLEATNISEGRGTALPFRIAGAPWMRSQQLAELFNEQADKAVARPVHFVPEAGKYHGQTCKGIMLHVHDPGYFRPVRTALLLLRLIRNEHPNDFAWAPYPTHVNNSGENHLRLLTGHHQPEKLFDMPMENFKEALNRFTDADQWPSMVSPYLLYKE